MSVSVRVGGSTDGKVDASSDRGAIVGGSRGGTAKGGACDGYAQVDDSRQSQSVHR